MAHIPQGLGWTIKKKGPYQLIQESSKAEINENPHFYIQLVSQGLLMTQQQTEMNAKNIDNIYDSLKKQGIAGKRSNKKRHSKKKRYSKKRHSKKRSPRRRR